MADLGAIGARGSAYAGAAVAPADSGGVFLGEYPIGLVGALSPNLKLDMSIGLRDWPSALPIWPNPNYGEDFGVNVLRTPPDAGPAKMRRIAKRPTTLSVSYEMTTAQVAVLEDFVANQLRGTYRFRYTHPRTKDYVGARFVPQNGGQFYSISPFAFEVWTVGFQLEVLQ